jgi:hypothetical protein
MIILIFNTLFIGNIMSPLRDGTDTLVSNSPESPKWDKTGDILSLS